MTSKSRLEAIRDHLEPASSSTTIAVEEQAEIPALEPGVQHPQTRTIFPPLELEEHPLDDVRKLRVVVVGAGISGITSAVLLPAKVPNLDLVIYERESDIVCRSSSTMINCC